MCLHTWSVAGEDGSIKAAMTFKKEEIGNNISINSNQHHCSFDAGASERFSQRHTSYAKPQVVRNGSDIHNTTDITLANFIGTHNGSRYHRLL